jgi:hypothetical protein
MNDFKKIPTYYKGKRYGYEARKVVEDYQPLNYNLATVLTYIMRAGKKIYVNDSAKESMIADIEKSINHLTFELDRLKNDK